VSAVAAYYRFQLAYRLLLATASTGSLAYRLRFMQRYSIFSCYGLAFIKNKAPPPETGVAQALVFFLGGAAIESRMFGKGCRFSFALVARKGMLAQSLTPHQYMSGAKVVFW